MTDQIDPELKIFMRRRMVQLAGWREIIEHGSQEERRRLVDSLKDIDLAPLLSTFEFSEDEVRADASHHRAVLALQAQIEDAIRAGDIDLAATLLDLKMNAEGEID
jgi:hypothetical protein